MMLFVNILFILGFALLLAWVLGVIGGLMAYVLGGKRKRKRKVFLAAISPAVAIGIWIVGSFVTMLLTSVICDIDLGIGDSWVAHLPNGYKLCSIDDNTWHGYITCDDQKVTISDDELRFDVSADVTNIQVVGDTVIGINQDNCVNFVLNTSKKSITLLENDKRISTMIDNGQIKILTLNEFYWESRKIPYMIGTVITLIVIILALFLLWEIGLYSLKKESNDP